MILIAHRMLENKLLRLAVWVAFAIVFYQSGLTFTTFLLESESISGVLDWIWVIAFPLLLPLFFVVNRRFGCASGQCAGGTCKPALRFPPGH